MEHKIKIFMTHSHYDDYGDANISLASGVSDWETVTTEELQWIKNHIGYISKHDGYYVIVEQKNVPEIITNIKETIERAQLEEKRRIEERERKRREDADKRAMKKLEKDRRALERLIKQNPDLLNGIVVDKGTN